MLLFGVLWFAMIRPQRAKAQAQQRMLGTVAPGDEILTVGGIYGIVQELEPDEDGGDLIVEIADGIHVRIARKALATVIKPEDDDEDDGRRRGRREATTTTTSSTGRRSPSPTTRSPPPA